MRTVREYLKLLADYFECHPEQRFGQAAYNFLWDYDPVAAAVVQDDDDSKIDPFYNDYHLTDFFRWLEERWS